jgi:glyoxylase-like metal-dependent hydrolase (beta-lactamase superfamily II)
MTTLDYSVHVAAAKVAVFDDLPPGEDRRRWSPTTSTLIFGQRDAILVDPLMTIDESRALNEWVTAAGKNVTDIFITYAHGDHFFGAPAVLERFPGARVVATADVAEHIPAQWVPRWFDDFWQPRFPGQISDQRFAVESLADRLLEIEGQQLRAIELGHTDTDGTSALYVPSIGVMVAGDAVYGEVHLYLAESTGDGRQRWLDALTTLERLHPGAVVAGHKREHDSDDPDLIDRTRRYIENFSAGFDKATTYTELYESMVALYPSRVTGACSGTRPSPSSPDGSGRYIAGHTVNRSACRRWTRLAGSVTVPHRSGQRQRVPS